MKPTEVMQALLGGMCNIPPCSPRPTTLHSLHCERRVWGMGAVVAMSLKIQLDLLLHPKGAKEYVWAERQANGWLVVWLLSCSRDVSRLCRTAPVLQDPGSHRWREMLPHVAGMAPGRCEKPDRFCLLKPLVCSLMADKFLGILISHHLGRVLIPAGKTHIAKKGAKLCRTWHLVRMERNQVSAYHTHPRQQPGETGSLRGQEQPRDSRFGAEHQLVSCTRRCCCLPSPAAWFMSQRKEKPLVSCG